MLKSMSAGTRSLVALGAFVGLSAATVLTLELEQSQEVVAPEPIEEVEPVILAAQPIDPEDFGVGEALDVRPATLRQSRNLLGQSAALRG